ncbi:hypothetical protein [Hydrogenimonas sp.]
MTLLFLFVAAAAGIVVLVYERRLKKENLARLQDYLIQVVSDTRLPSREKMIRIMDLFRQNNYKIEEAKSEKLVVSRREFGVGAALLWFSAAGIGLLVYLIYYFLKKPETLYIDLRTGMIDAA